MCIIIINQVIKYYSMLVVRSYYSSHTYLCVCSSVVNDFLFIDCSSFFYLLLAIIFLLLLSSFSNLN